MKTIVRIIALTGALAFSGIASADTIPIGASSCPADGSNYTNVGGTDYQCFWILDNRQSRLGSNVEAATGSGPLNELYKAEVGGTDGLGYDVEFDSSPTEPADATITWGGEGIIECSDTNPCYLAVKDGKKLPAVYVFDISYWDGEDTIVLTGFWENCDADLSCTGAISNITIWGTSTTVPEPGTLALLGLGLFSMGLMRRRQAS